MQFSFTHPQQSIAKHNEKNNSRIKKKCRQETWDNRRNCKFPKLRIFARKNDAKGKKGTEGDDCFKLTNLDWRVAKILISLVSEGFLVIVQKEKISRRRIITDWYSTKKRIYSRNYTWGKCLPVVYEKPKSLKTTKDWRIRKKRNRNWGWKTK